MPHVPRSEQFDDVYFSVQDGLSETRHVFLQGNNLPEAWSGTDDFTICETGFGTGLNFLAVLQLLARSQDKPKRVHYISFEKYPLQADEIKRYLAHWPELAVELDILLSKYPANINHNIENVWVCDGVELTLIFGDVNDEMPKLQEQVDCWFLDGFKPSSNADMWSETVFENMARLSNPDASFATFTSAGFVRRGLETVGFGVRKVPGYGRKREMCVGQFNG